MGDLTGNSRVEKSKVPSKRKKTDVHPGRIALRKAITGLVMTLEDTLTDPTFVLVVIDEDLPKGHAVVSNHIDHEKAKELIDADRSRRFAKEVMGNDGTIKT